MRTLQALLGVAIAVAIAACDRSETRTGAQAPPAGQPPAVGAPPPAPAAAAARVTSIELGTAIGPDGRVAPDAARTTFSPSDTIYLAVLTDKPAAGATVTARWTYEDGQVVNESRETLESADRAAEFHIAKPDGWPTGRYRVEVAMNDQPAGTREFEVR